MNVESDRTMGLFGATGVGVGAIVGGGVLALAGVAFAATGPSAMIAFALNGLVALLTALSFAEMASKFPESGGVYTYSKKVLSVEAAFTVGWVVWFASVVAAVLYAIGFAFFTTVLVGDLWQAVRDDVPGWLTDSRLIKALAVATIIALTLRLMRRSAGGGQWVNVAKVFVFGMLILGGVAAVARQPVSVTRSALSPFLPGGLSGLIQAMGYTFIALQGFDLIAAVGGEVRNPSKNVPRAMVLSLSIAIAIYIPLLFIVSTVGVSGGESIQEAAGQDPEAIIAVAAQNYLGTFGYWLVILAAVLSMFSALQANLFASSRIVRTMARDRTLPSALGSLSRRYQTPAVAAAVTALLASVILLALPDVAAAGAAASLIFLITFALAHWIAVLVRRRSRRFPPPFRVPFFPLVPAVGGAACLALAVFQGIAVPSAGSITLLWLSIGGALFLGLFARRARMTDVSRTARNPELLTLRGRTPLVLVPIANPGNAEAMIRLANALVPADVGRVLMHTVVVAPTDWQPDIDETPVDKVHPLIPALLRASGRVGIRVETMITVASEPMSEIARVAQLHRCGSVLLGLSEIAADARATHLESLLGELDTNVVVLRARPHWQLDETTRIVVPVAGRGGHEHLLAQLIGSLLRGAHRQVTFLRVMSLQARPDELRRARRELEQLIDDDLVDRCRAEVVQSDDAVMTVAQWADESDLLILGVQRLGRRHKLFGEFTRRVAKQTKCSIVVVSRRG